MSLRKLAELIPHEYRRELLELNLIDTAVATDGNEPMHYLVTIWQQYIEYDFQPDCNLCRSRVLNNFKGMKKTLIDLEQEYQLLKTA